MGVPGWNQGVRTVVESPVTVSIVIPAFDEEARVGAVVRSARPYCDEVLVVDDGSQDGTARAAEEAGARVIRQVPNQGYISAIKRGFQEAGGVVLVTLDGDGQFDPSEIPAVVKPILENEADMVQGHRLGFIRPSERFLTWVSSLFGPVGDSGTGFRAGKTDLFRSLELEGRCICGIFSLEVLRRGGRISEVPVSLRPSPKPGNIAWYHVPQLGFLLREAFHLIRVQSGR